MLNAVLIDNTIILREVESGAALRSRLAGVARRYVTVWMASIVVLRQHWALSTALEMHGLVHGIAH